MVKQIQTKEISKEIKNLSRYFPVEIDHIEIFNIENKPSIAFISKDKFDHTNKFIKQIVFSKNKSIYDISLEELIKFDKIADELKENNTVQIKVKLYNHKVQYLNPDAFAKARTSQDISKVSLGYQIGINTATIHKIENSEPIDHAISIIVKYSLFFNRNIMTFFDKSLSKELLKIMLYDFVAQGVMEKEQVKKILELKQFN